MADEGKVFKKQYVDRQGNVQEIETKIAKKTINDELSEKLEETKEEWKKASKSVITNDFKDKLKKLKGKYFKYIIKNKAGKQQARNGGVLTKIDDKFLMLLNTRNNIAWSVQYKNIVALYEIPTNAQAKKVEPENKEIEKEAKKRKKEIQKEEDQEAKDEHKEKDEKKAKRELKKKEKEEKLKQLKEEKERKRLEKQKLKEEKEKNKKPPRKKWSDEDVDKELTKLYYDEDLTYGRDKLFKTLQERGIDIPRHRIEKWLKSQKLYQMTKPTKKQKNFQIIQSKNVNKVWNIDLVEIGSGIILGCIDSFSRYSYGRVLPDKKAKSVVDGLKSILNGGTPSSPTASGIAKKPSLIVSDNGPEFVGKETEAFLKKESIKHITTTPHNPQANGKIERWNRTIKDLYKKLDMKDEQSIHLDQDILNKLVKSYNNSYHEKIKMSPVEAIKPENHEEINSINKKHASFETINADDVKVGDKVRVVVKHEEENAKQYRPNWSEEIYTITSIRRPKNILAKPIQYKIKDFDSDEKHRGYFTRNEIQVVEDVKNDDKVNVKYYPEKIKEMRGNKVLIKWKGYRSNSKNNTWELKKDIKADVGEKQWKEMIEEFENK